MLRRHPSIVLVVCVGSVLSVTGACWQYLNNQELLENALRLRATHEAARLQKDIARAGEALASVPRLFAASKTVEQGEFRTFAGGVLDTHPEFQALEWLPRIPDSERASFESELSRIAPSSVITQLNEQRELVRADQRTEYFPVLFSEPFEPNKAVLGFDAASRSEILEAMHFARDSGRTASTGDIRFIQGRQHGVLLVAPAYHQYQLNASTATRRTSLAGYAVGALLYDVLLENSLKGSIPTGLDWLLIDPSAPPASNLLYYHPSRTRSQASTSIPDPAVVRTGLHFEATIVLPGREWHLLFLPAPAFDAEFASYWHWIILLTGLTLTGLLAHHMARRIQAESTLKQQKDLLASIIENSPMRVFWKDKESRYLGCNSQFAHDAGLTYPEELLGRTDFEMSWRDQANLYRADDRAVMESGLAKLDFDEPQTTPDGDTIWLRTSKVPLRDQQDETIGVLGLYHDITRERNMQIHLAESEARFRSIIEASPVPMALNDDQENITYLNPAFMATFGYDNAEIPTLADWWPRAYPDADYRQWVSTEWARRLAGCREQHTIFEPMELKVRCKDGAIRFAISSAAMLGVEFGGTHLVILYDITERKVAEDNLRIAAVTFESQEAVLITDANANIIRVNAAFEEISGYRAEEVIGRNPRLLQSGRHDAAFYQAMWASIQKTGQWAGEIWDRRKSGEIYPKFMTLTAVRDKQGTLTNYVSVATDISLRKQSEEEIRQLAFFDPLTRLPNRRLFQDRLQHTLAASQRSGHYVAVMLLDLDRFKTINDSLGHAVGDLLLIEVARRLRAAVRESDTIARLGGDEFIVILEPLDTNRETAASQAGQVAENIRQVLGQPYQLTAHELRSTPSIGITLSLGHVETEPELIKQADVALYAAKAAGRNTIRFYDPQMQAALNKRATLEADLYLALERQEFQLHYQIQVDSQGRTLGAEALLRWQPAERGFIYPDQFIPVAEESGLIVPIGLWVLETACAQLVAWAHAPLTCELTLAVNVSAQQFRQADFVAQVQRVLRLTGANPARLKLELTESLLLDNVEDAIGKMRTLREQGVAFSLDDFGTGHSSLSYLKRLPLAQIKIDRSFVRDIATDANDAAIVNTIIVMSQTLGMDVIAEGVETETQRDFLAHHGCHAFQGYLFGKPVSLEQFEASLTNTS